MRNPAELGVLGGFPFLVILSRPEHLLVIREARAPRWQSTAENAGPLSVHAYHASRLRSGRGNTAPTAPQPRSSQIIPQLPQMQQIRGGGGVLARAGA